MDDRADMAQVTPTRWQVLAGTSYSPGSIDDPLSFPLGLDADRANTLDAAPFDVKPGLLAGKALAPARFTDPVVAKSAQVLSGLTDLVHDHDKDSHWRRLAGLLGVMSDPAKC